MYFKGNGLYFFCFRTEEDLIPIAARGHTYFGKSLLILQRWQAGMDFLKRDPTIVPIWVNFHNVPLPLWHDDGFAFLSSHFGKPLFLDDATKFGNKLLC